MRFARKGTPTAVLIGLVFLLGRVAAGQESPSVKEMVDYYVAEHARTYGVDPRLVHAVIEVESDYNQKALSPRKAKGLMQLMPGTQKRFGVTEPFSISENIRGGVAYLSYLNDLFDGRTAYAIAAYYSGEGYVVSKKGVVSKEVFGYVQKVARNYRKSVRRGAIKSRAPYPRNHHAGPAGGTVGRARSLPNHSAGPSKP